MFSISVLSSGSSGNATYVKAGRTELLFDAGLSKKKIFSHLEEIGANPENLDAIFISHEHSDHVKGLGPVQRALGIPVYATKETLGASYAHIARVDDVHAFTGGLVNLDPVEFGNTSIQPIRVPHDAADPTGFVVEHKGKRLAIFTDLGRATTPVREAIANANCAVLESNHCIDMLWNGPYPIYLKQRIASPHGHLSNDQAASLLIESEPDQLRAVFLAHRSMNNNSAERAHALLDHARSSLGNGMTLVHTSRLGPTGLVSIGKKLTKSDAQEVQPNLALEEVPRSRRSRKDTTLNKYMG